MSVQHRPDSLKELRGKPTLEELARENEELKSKNKQLEEEVTATQIALVEVFETLLAVTDI